jgi:hypothetical protein
MTPEDEFAALRAERDALAARLALLTSPSEGPLKMTASGDFYHAEAPSRDTEGAFVDALTNLIFTVHERAIDYAGDHPDRAAMDRKVDACEFTLLGLFRAARLAKAL